jgi:hypothetical protein
MKITGNGKHAKLRAIAYSAAVVALVIACIALANCSAGSASPESIAPASESSAAAKSSEPGEASSAVSANSDSVETDPDASQEQQSKQLSALPGETTSQNAVSGVSGAASQTGSAHEETPPTSAPAASGGESQKQPVWVVDYEDIWVEDSPEWDESVPIYGYTEVSICNICGAEITGNTTAHGKQHMLAGEGSGHHSEVRETVTGYETVHHAAQGHWEKAESGGHWE